MSTLDKVKNAFSELYGEYQLIENENFTLILNETVSVTVLGDSINTSDMALFNKIEYNF